MANTTHRIAGHPMSAGPRSSHFELVLGPVHETESSPFHILNPVVELREAGSRDVAFRCVFDMCKVSLGKT